jgi:DNA excision repair protein ERCC-2
LDGIKYPYDHIRPGQEELSRSIVGAALRKEGIAVEAPNGFGKTAAALAAVNFLVAEQGFTCIYAVRTKREMDRVLVEMERFGDIAACRASPLISMADGCLFKNLARVPIAQDVLPHFCRESVFSGSCFYYAAVERSGRFVSPAIGRVDEFIKQCDSLRICPYFLSRNRASASDVIVTTYPHLLSDPLRSRLISSGRGWKKTVVVFDEAHNLPEAIYWSTGRALRVSEVRASLSSSLRRGREEEHSFGSDLLSWVESLGLVEGEQKVCEADALLKTPLMKTHTETLMLADSRKASMVFLAEPLDAAFILRIRLIEFASALSKAFGRGDGRIIVTAHGDNTTIAVRFLDTRKEFAGVMAGLWCPVFLSATFFSYQGFASALGIGRDCSFVRVETDPLERRCVTLVDASVTTEYKHRGRGQYGSIAARLANIRAAVEGGVACFFPSYEVLQGVQMELSNWTAAFTTVSEKREMTPGEQAEAIAEVTRLKTSALLGVMGGKFSEGEDFAEGVLSAVAIVGLPLPPPSKELQMRMSYEGSQGGPWAYDSLVLTPAVAKVVQAAGRLFRRRGQGGLVVLLDRRFRRGRVTSLFPRWLRENLEEVDCSDAVALRRHWQEASSTNTTP